MSMTTNIYHLHHSPVWYWTVVFFICTLSFPAYAQQNTEQPAITTAAIDTENKTQMVAPADSSDNTSSAVSSSPYYSANSSNSKVGSGSHLLSVTFALLFIVVLIVAVSWFIRRFGQGVFANTSQMKIITTMPLGTRERIMLVEIGGQQLLLGVTASQINTLHVFTEPVVFANQTTPASDFSRKLMTILQQKNNPSPTTSNNPPEQN